MATGEAGDQVFHEKGPDALTRTVFTEPLERIIRDGISEGLIESERNPGEVATLLFNTVGWTYIHLRSGHRWDQKHARAAVVELALRGVLAQ